MKLYTLPNDNNFDLHGQRLNRDSNFVQLKCNNNKTKLNLTFFVFLPSPLCNKLIFKLKCSYILIQIDLVSKNNNNEIKFSFAEFFYLSYLCATGKGIYL